MDEAGDDDDEDKDHAEDVPWLMMLEAKASKSAAAELANALRNLWRNMAEKVAEYQYKLDTRAAEQASARAERNGTTPAAVDADENAA